ncbi:MAG: hypothetical protein J4F40_15810 [Alphaproteobacteria bacterium]|nr:hypothetical protein [Alphaproteobacteria bacterium]
MDKEFTLDENASRCLDELMKSARARGLQTPASVMVSNAVRCWYALATGRATLNLSPELVEEIHSLDDVQSTARH